MSKVCVLKRCQGKRGCLCPKGNVPVGSYAGRKLDPIPSATVNVKKTSSSNNNNKTELTKPVSKASSPKKLAPLKQASPSNIIPAPDVSKSNGDEKNLFQEKIGAQSSDTTAATVPPEDSPYSDFNGEVMIRYNHYKKKFPAEKGKVLAEAIDAEYYLSFAFPKCKIHVTPYGPSDFSFEEEGHTTRPLMKESPPGTFHGMNPSVEYWVEIEEDSQERQEYEARQDALAAANAKKRAEEEARGGAECIIIKNKTESCSCIEGNPCLDRYACKNWEKRYEIAKANGWKGFQ